MTKKSVVAQLADIQTLPTPALKARWRELYDTEPPSGSRSYLVRRLSHRVQELAYGGVSDATRARLRKHIEEVGLVSEGADPDRTAQRRGRKGQPVAGTTFTREWHGERHEVTAIDGGFEYRGRKFRSLSAIAKAITGAHWSGNLFFGLRSRKGGK
jgi:hypothetical protein